MSHPGQPALFHESIHDALREVILVLGGTKSVGARMRPDMSPDHAGRWLADCLSDERSEKLSPSQVLWLLREGRKAGLHWAMAFIDLDAGYADPVPVEPEDERARLQREYIEAVHAMARLAERMDRVNLRVA